MIVALGLVGFAADYDEQLIDSTFVRICADDRLLFERALETRLWTGDEYTVIEPDLGEVPETELITCIEGGYLGTLVSFPYVHEFTRFLDDGTVERLGDLDGLPVFSVLADATDDGRVLVGYHVIDLSTDYESPRFAIAWDGAFRRLDDTVDGVPATSSEATGVSRDGATILGVVEVDGHERAVVWDEDGVHALTAGGDDSRAVAASDDGRVIIGSIGGSAVRWVDRGDPEVLGEGSAFAVSPDGGVIATSGGIWTEASGLISVRSLAEAAGAYIPADRRLTVLGMSRDGRTLAGNAEVGTHQPPVSNYEVYAFRLELDGVEDDEAPLDTDAADTDLGSDTDADGKTCGCNGGSASWVSVIALGALVRRKRQ